MLSEDPKPSDFPVAFGRYTLLELLGQGASSQVFLAEMLGAAGFRKRVALKIMRQQFGGDETNFVREGRLCGLLNHRNVVDTYEFGVDDNQAFIAMEFIDGVTLSSLCQLGPLPPSVVLEVGLHICRGLDYAHSLHGVEGPFGLVHRDVKPSNILVGWDGSVKVADFGIAVLTAADTPNAAQAWLGSPGYMSPEQWNKHPLDASSDVFSLCVILYQMCTAQRLIHGDDIDGRRQAALAIESLLQNPATLLPVGQHIAGLDRVLAEGLRLNPEERIANAQILGTQLRQLQRTVAREPSLEDWLAQTLDKQEQNWGDLKPVDAPIKPIRIAPLPTLESPGKAAPEHAITAAITKLFGSTALEDVLGILVQVERALAGLPTHQRKGHLESVLGALTETGLQLVRQGEFPHLIADRKTGRYWYQGEESIELRPGSLSERFLYAVATRGPELSRVALYEHVWEQPYLPPSSDNVLRVRAHKVRAALAPSGLTIERYGDGQYVLSGKPAVLSWQPEAVSSGTGSGGPGPHPDNPSTNIEHPPNTFIGRIREMEALTRLHTQQRAVVTILGPPGTGKTRMAKEWARAQLEAGAVQSAWFCDLSASITTMGVLGVVAQSIGVQLRGSDRAEEQLIERLGYAIAGRVQTLLILDNVEQVSAEVRHILNQWCSSTTNARFLVTSREPLGLQMEQRLPLAPLPVPAASAVSSSLAANDAIALFVERAQAVQPGFSIGDHNADTIAAIVTQLDGLPLAIELAAARSCVLSSTQILDRLSERFKLLKGGASPRQETLEAALQWSWDLLEPWEQAALAQLSVFQDGFFMEAAEAILDLSSWPDAPWSLDVLESLLDKSLIHSRKMLEIPRFDMYMSIQEYASEKLTAGPWPEQCGDMLRESRLRHARYFAQFGTQNYTASLQIHGGVGRIWRLRIETENLMAGARAGLEYNEDDTAANCTIATATSMGPTDVSVKLLGKILDKTQLDPFISARLLNARGWLLNQRGNNTESLDHFERAREIYRELGNVDGEGKALYRIGLTYRHQGQMDKAAQFAEQALAYSRRTGNRLQEGRSLGVLAVVYKYAGLLDKAIKYFKQELAITRELGNRRGEGIALGNLALVHVEGGHYPEAHTEFEEALGVARELGDRRSEGIVLCNLAGLQSARGQTSDARASIEQALTIAREVGNRRNEGITLGNLGELLLQMGKTKEAEACLQQSIAICDHTSPPHAGNFCGSLALIHAQAGRIDEARALFARGELQVRGVMNRVLGGLLCKKAQVEHIAGNLDAANEAFAEAQEIAASIATGSPTALDALVVETSQILGTTPGS